MIYKNKIFGTLMILLGITIMTFSWGKANDIYWGYQILDFPYLSFIVLISIIALIFGGIIVLISDSSKSEEKTEKEIK